MSRVKNVLQPATRWPQRHFGLIFNLLRCPPVFGRQEPFIALQGTLDRNVICFKKEKILLVKNYGNIFLTVHCIYLHFFCFFILVSRFCFFPSWKPSWFSKQTKVRFDDQNPSNKKKQKSITTPCTQEERKRVLQIRTSELHFFWIHLVLLVRPK